MSAILLVASGCGGGHLPLPEPEPPEPPAPEASPGGVWQGTSSLGFTRVAAPRSFEPSRATAPPPVPEARRPLLFNYFIRRR